MSGLRQNIPFRQQAQEHKERYIRKEDRTPYAAQQRLSRTAKTCTLPAQWKMSSEQAKRLRLPVQSDNWSDE